MLAINYPRKKTAFLLLAARLGFNASAANWPQFRGPQASGVDAVAAAPIRWDTESGTNILWRAPIPGLAHAA